MRSFGLALLSALAVSHVPPFATAAPVIPGLAGKHPLTVPQVGQLLIQELRCIACHTSKTIPQSTERAAPDLEEVGARVAPTFLQQFIASPSTAHPGSTMPDLLAGLPADRRVEIAEALTHFLVAQSSRQFKQQPVDEQEAAPGKVLFHSVGCVVCHASRADDGKEIPRDGAVGLGHVPAKYSLASLGDFLFQPLRVRPSGRMPDMKLTPVEARAIACYLLGAGSKVTPAFRPQPGLVAQGKEYFQQLNCAACHKVGDIPAAKPVGSLEVTDTTRGCLSETPDKAPWFHLSADQTKAIRAALSRQDGKASERDGLALTLTTFNCIGCHVRDDYGGVRAEVNEFFLSSEKELGDEGRIPPPLTLVGAKLQPVSMKKVLFDGDSVRSYMATRMPQFGEPNLRHLPGLFGRLDAVKQKSFSLPRSEGGGQQEREREKELRAAGRELVGDQGLYCIACHGFKGKTPNKQGIDLLTFPERLQPSWFYHFVRDPDAFRPRSVMPTAWPGGQAVHRKILDGDTDRQIEAIWYYLTLGTSAPDPSGVRAAETLLSVKDVTRTYRGRSTIAGYRGIAVGFPDRLNYAFNAETGTLSALWRGDFVRVNRSGQGSGSFNPAGKSVPLAQDVSFFDLSDEKSAWPLRPVMSRESLVNPDPLYPKNCGYQFKGYYMDDNSVPTFMYRSGDIEIADRSAVQTEEGKLRLVRELSFDSPRDQPVWFRALTGKIEAESKIQFKSPGLRLRIPTVPTVLRPMVADPDGSELLLKFEIPRGKSKQTISYELLP